jgi:rhamnose utilization protein RhaD (predicted bifunctional aldolase and dehydrogenase)
MNQDATLENLINLSHELGSEDRHLAILGEGNTSALCENGTFWVKASGSQLGNIDAGGFCLVNMQAALDLIEKKNLDDKQLAAQLQNVLVDPTQRKPSVETFLHALCLSEAGARWVGHTHPESVNSILCSQAGAAPFLQPLFPDQIVVCGLPAVVPYTDPGAPLSLAVRAELRRYQDANGISPKTLLIENHGLVALGSSAREVLSITLMADKWARIILGSYAMGGLHALTGAQADRIANRPDEHFRRKLLEKS